MFKNKIEKIRAKEIFDSRKRKTIEVEIVINKEIVLSKVPSGASTGKYEAVVIDTKKAVKNINQKIGPKLIGKDPQKQNQIDNFLIKLDGTKNKSKLGANTICGVSMAVCRAGAKVKKIPLYRHINELFYEINNQKTPLKLPKPSFNIINGGAHAEDGLDIQEFMIIPQEKSFLKNLNLGIKIYNELKNNLIKIYGKKAIRIGDEGGFVPFFRKTEEAIKIIIKSSKSKKIKIALDSAASQFFKNKKYILDGKDFSSEEMIDFYQKLTKKFPLISIEDPFEEQDFNSWSQITKKMGQKILIIGDDLLVTNPELIKKAERKKACNGMILKINQIGTIKEALKSAFLARKFKWKIMVSHRSGETSDDFIADLSVGIGAEFIKSGAPFPQERMAKYNRLVEIEKDLYNN